MSKDKSIFANKQQPNNYENNKVEVVPKKQFTHVRECTKIICQNLYVSSNMQWRV